jgi:hypothetical protein
MKDFIHTHPEGSRNKENYYMGVKSHSIQQSSVLLEPSFCAQWLVQAYEKGAAQLLDNQK